MIYWILLQILNYTNLRWEYDSTEWWYYPKWYQSSYTFFTFGFTDPEPRNISLMCHFIDTLPDSLQVWEWEMVDWRPAQKLTIFSPKMPQFVILTSCLLIFVRIIFNVQCSLKISGTDHSLLLNSYFNDTSASLQLWGDVLLEEAVTRIQLYGKTSKNLGLGLYKGGSTLDQIFTYYNIHF